MDRNIIKQLDFIRKRECNRLLEGLRQYLMNNEAGYSRPANDLIDRLATLTNEMASDDFSDYGDANYDKLSDLIIHLLSQNKKTDAQLQAIGDDLKMLEELWREAENGSPADETNGTIENNRAQIYARLHDSADAIRAWIGKTRDKLSGYLPEQMAFKPLGPFFFFNKKTDVNKKMISVIVLNDNGADHLKELFDSFLKYNTYRNVEIILLDRTSTDNSLEIAKHYQQNLSIVIIPVNPNLTDAYLYNLAVDSCKSEYILFLNNKAILKNDMLGVFHDTLQKGRSNGIIGALISLNDAAHIEDGQKEYYGSVKFTIRKMTDPPDVPFPLIDPGFMRKSKIIASGRQYNKQTRVYLPPSHPYTCLTPMAAGLQKKSRPEPVPAVYHTAMFCRRTDFIRTGGFDLNFFNGFEDIDLCLTFADHLGKRTLLAHPVDIHLNAERLHATSSPSMEEIENFNLGILLNKHGYYIKNKYFTAPGNEQNYPNGILKRKLSIAIKAPPFHDERAPFWGDYHFAHSLKNAFLKKGYPARVDLYDQWYEKGFMTDDVVIVLRGLYRYHPRGSQINILWNISHPELISPDEYHDYDHVFTASDIYARALMDKHGIHADPLLQCTDPGLFYPDRSDPGEEEKTDILFVGNSRGVLRKPVAYSMQKGIPVTIYGPNWEKFLPPEMISGTFIQNEDLRKYYSNCNILLNDHWDEMAEGGFISNRIFDALACGAVIVTDRVKEIEKVFPGGLFYYDSADTFEEQIQWIRNHFTAARKRALKNVQKVLKYHTFDRRAETILQVVLKIHRQKTKTRSGVMAYGNRISAQLKDLVNLKKRP